MPPELAQAAYEAYAGDDGRPPALAWDRLPPKTQDRWRRSVRKTLEGASGGGATVAPGTSDGEERYG